MIGVVVIILMLLGALAVGSARSMPVAGQPEAVPVPGAPAVGTCLRQPVTGVNTVTSQGNQPIFNTVAIGDCTGVHYGEIVAVVNHRLPIPADSPTVLDPYQKWCSPALDAWTGPRTDPLEQNWVLEFQFIRQVSIVFAGPDQRQLASGQLWVACIAVPQVTGSTGGTSTPYEKSIRNGFTRQPAPPGLSTCSEQQSDTYATTQTIDCTRAHRAEVLGHKALNTDSGAPLTAGEQRSCTQFAASVTGMADPTAGGRLTIKMQVAEPADAQPGMWADAWCVISPTSITQYLYGPLLGLGNAPLPLR